MRPTVKTGHHAKTTTTSGVPAQRQTQRQAQEQETQAKFQQALALHQTGQWAHAKTLYEAVLKLQPQHFDALHLLGVVAAQTGDAQSAVTFMRQALAINPNVAAAHNNCGNALKDLKQWEAALISYDHAIALKPDYAEAYNNRGNAYKDLKQWDAALASYDQAIALKPDYAEAYSNRGNAYKACQRWDAALASYDQAIALKPDYVEAHHNRSVVLTALKQWDAALRSADRAIALRSNDAEAYYQRANVLQDWQRWDEALVSYDQALALKPDHIEVYNNRGNALRRLGQWQAALTSYEKALALKPDYAEVYNNLGLAFQDLHQWDEALASYEKAIALQPDHAESYWNKALVLLLRGDFARGWEAYEWRWKMDSFSSPRRGFTQPLWLGKEPLTGKTMLLHGEQGLGDTLQFCRYAKQVADLGARVIIEVPSPLIQILTHLAGVAQLVALGTPLPAFDYHCPLLSLPLAFRTNETTIPATPRYLTSDTNKVAQWQVALGTKTRPRVGLVWRGGSAHKNDYNRSMSCAALLAALPPGIDYISLQKDVRDADQAALQSHSTVQHFGERLTDFSDTAAVCELLDVIISVDTSVAHLACALGKPVWLLLPASPDWRWLLDRTDSPWYPTATLYRQQSVGEWRDVLTRVHTDLLKLLTSAKH